MSKATLFDSLYGATTEAVKAAKKPFVETKVRLAIAGAVNNANIAIANLTGKVDKALSDVVIGDDTRIAGNIQALVNAKSDLETAKQGLVILQDLEAALFTAKAE